MKKAIGAILWHCTRFKEKDDDYRHRFCPLGKERWCKDKVTGKKTHKDKINLPEWIHDIIEPIFVSLSCDELLKKCLHGQTQNPNATLNKVIWTKCPKNMFVHKNLLEMGVHSVIL